LRSDHTPATRTHTSAPARRGLEWNARAARLIEADRDRLTRRSGTMPPLANVLDLLANEFAGGGRRALASREIALGLAGRALGRHEVEN
jgi:hypothetical protein